MTDEEVEASKNAGLKLKPSKTRLIQKQAKKTFEEQAAATHQRLEGHLKEAYELGVEYTKLMADTRLPENVGPFEQGFEKEVVRKLINYGITVNADRQEQEGMGSVSLITLILKSMFKMRDKMNGLSYNQHLLERRVQHLEKTILSSQTQATDESE